MTCPHIEEGTCNRGCRGFQCRRREEQPVGWRVRGYSQFKTGTPGAWRYFDGAERPKVNNPTDCDFEPLYTAAGVKGLDRG